MEKSPEAFRTISEVADLLDTPAHVLRFWESRFPQIRPVKRAGGRRYYRPGDVALLAGIKKLLHDDGLTIRGVQKILREQGIRHVSGLAAPLPDPLPGEAAVIEIADDAADDAQFLLSVLPSPSTPPETAQIIPLGQVFARQESGRTPTVPDDTVLSDGPLEEVPEAPFMEAEDEPEVAENLPLFVNDTRDGTAADEASDTAFVAEEQGNLFASEEVATDRAPVTPTPGSEEVAGPEEDATTSDAETVAGETSDGATVATLLRRSRRARLALHRAELERLHDRLADLRDRVAEASRRRVR